MVKKQTRVIAIAATKGGVGKSTMTAALATHVASTGAKVALLDLDGQGSVHQWWQLRGEPDNPKLVGLDATQEGVGLAIAQGWDWVFIDTPPGTGGGDLQRIEVAVHNADLVIVPVRPSPFDVMAYRPVVDICLEQVKPYFFLINQVQGKGAAGTETFFEGKGPVLATRIVSRVAYQHAIADGRTGSEIDSKAAGEIEALWAEIKTLALIKRSKARG
jgi:chromosome partitioning protein